MKKLSKIEALEDIVGKRGADYYLISTTDDFLNEYVPEYNMRLRWLTNFSGSNGIALISKKKNFFLLMVDTHCRQKKSFQKYLRLKI